MCGLSMGGSGAFKVGMMCNDAFGAIGCLSAGALNTAGGIMNSPTRTLSYGDSPVVGTEYDPLFHAERILKENGPYPKIYHACGGEDFLLQSARETRDYFQNIKNSPFEYTYIEDEGAHTWDYWDRHLQKFIDFLNVEKEPEIFY